MTGGPAARRRTVRVAGAGLALVALTLIALLALYGLLPGGSSENGATVVWAVGDGADGGERAVAVAEMMAESGIDRLLYVGDVYETGTAHEFEQHYEPVYGRFAEATLPTIGNHEWANREKGYLPYWEQVRGDRQPLHYLVEEAGWEIVSVNSEGGPRSDLAQARWLRRELDRRGDCRIVFWHTPRYGASPGADYGDQPSVEPLWEALEGRAVITVHGDQHNMQRFKPIDGVTEFVSGAGGHGLYELTDDRRLAFGEDEEYGALRLELEPGAARHAFVAEDGDVLDSGTISCDPRRGGGDEG